MSEIQSCFLQEELQQARQQAEDLQYGRQVEQERIQDLLRQVQALDQEEERHAFRQQRDELLQQMQTSNAPLLLSQQVNPPWQIMFALA